MTNKEHIEGLKVIKPFLQRLMKKTNYEGWGDLDAMEVGETIDVAIDAIEEMDKYGWHDLRENPDDLPKKDGFYWVHGIWANGKHQEGECAYDIQRGRFEVPFNVKVLGWKTVEPFEVEE